MTYGPELYPASGEWIFWLGLSATALGAIIFLVLIIMSNVKRRPEQSVPSARTSFVRIAPGGNVDGLHMIDNRIHGDGDFLSVGEGASLRNANLVGNRQNKNLDEVPPSPSASIVRGHPLLVRAAKGLPMDDKDTEPD
ncbi:hypothetical protein [Oricola thermophila]|uniref:Uncharacterized protein n=1 Tax=Oricola thermophila TaxID=2742145 RepID=A0A6N1VLS8_9HYPH|nr:hypothetical protein [Oricola thermophila]QKV19907.1 hypothetical protein HTY61_16340 [Oricola thermophila]